MNRESIRQQLEPAIHAQLDELVSANHCGAGPLALTAGQTELRIRLTSVDRLACELESLSVTNPGFGRRSTDELNKMADLLADKLSYLEERLIVLEVDDVAADVQMRSESPHVDDSVRSYFEVHVGRSGITLQRFAKQDGQPRQTVPAALTRRILSRACVDLVDVAE